MKRIAFLLVGIATMVGLIASSAPVSGHADDQSGIKIPAGYRDWKLISVAHEAGDFNDFRAVLGNDTAIKAYRDGTRPFPDGAISAVNSPTLPEHPQTFS